MPEARDGHQHSAHLVGPVPEHLRERRIDLDDPARHIRQPRTDTGLREYATHPCFAGPQLFFGGAPGRDFGGANALLFGEHPRPEGAQVTVGEGPQRRSHVRCRDTEAGEVGAENMDTAAQYLVTHEVGAGEIGTGRGRPLRVRPRGGGRTDLGRQPSQQTGGFGGTHRHDVIARSLPQRCHPSAGQVGIQALG